MKFLAFDTSTEFLSIALQVDGKVTSHFQYAGQAASQLILPQIQALLESAKVKLNELYSKHNVRGDKKVVYKTDIVRKYPKYPLFKNENFVPLDYLYLLIDQDYYLKPINEVLCIVDYQIDGSSLNIFRQYRKNPNGFAFSRISRIEFGATFKERFKNAIHLISSALFAKNLSLLFRTRKYLLIFLAIPFGLVLHLYILIKTVKK